jgi:TolA-binding protein
MYRKNTNFWRFALLLLMSCAIPHKEGPKEALLPEIDVLQMKENTEAAIKISRQTKIDIDAVNSRLSELERVVVDIQNTIAALPLARTEELENSIVLLNEELHTLKRVVDGKNKYPTFTTSGIRKKQALLPDQPPAYKKASLLFNRKEFVEAITAFQKFIIDKPQSSYVDDAWYWIGEAHYNLGDYTRSISSLQRVFSFVQTDKGDDAQFKLGLCYLRLGDAQQAGSEFKKLSVIYPESEYITKAKLEMDKLGIQQ